MPAQYIKRIFLSLFAFVALSLCLFVSSSHAQSYYPPPPQQTDQHTLAQTTLVDMMSAVVCVLAGIDPARPNQPCGGAPQLPGQISAQPQTQRPNGLVTQMAYMIGGTYNIPIHTSDYTNYLASNFGLAKKTYAQETGVGFTNLTPVLGIWTHFRDLAYLSFVVIFVLLGLGIMLRVKIDPRAVMTIQNQIPKVIISILLITLSYSIAGLLIDTMWTATYLGINILTIEPPCDQGTSVAAPATNNLLNTPMHYVSNLFSYTGCGGSWGLTDLSYKIGLTVGDIIASLVGSVFTGVGQSQNSCFSVTAGINVGECINQALFGVSSFLIGIAATLIVLIAILVQLFRVWFALIKAYIAIIVYTILAPGYILLGLLPGAQSFGFEQWLRHMASALSVFPVTVMFFLLAVVVGNNEAINNPQVAFIPPLVGNPAITGNFGMIMALGVILLAPEVTGIMRNAFKTKPSSYVAPMIGATAVGAGAVGAVAGGVGQQLFGRNKAGQLGPAAYYALRGLGWFTGGRYADDPSKAVRLGKLRNMWDRQKWKTEQPRYYTDPLTGQTKKVQSSNTGGSGGAGGTNNPAGGTGTNSTP